MSPPNDAGGAPVVPHRPVRRPARFVAAAGCLLLGVVLGGVISAVFHPFGGGPARGPGEGGEPAEADLDRLIAVAPGVTLRRWEYIILHHTATEVENKASIDRAHRRKGWRRGAGYDFIIGNGSRSADGQIEVTDRWRRQLDGAHCLAGGMNQRAIGIAFVGNFERDPGPTGPQLVAGFALVRHLAARFAIPPENILGHGEVSGARTLCPGKYFPIELMRAAAKSPARSR